MSAWDAYPDDYRENEIRAILSALRAGECVSVLGLSGAGKSNLLGFLYHRVPVKPTEMVMIDGNRVRLLAPETEGAAAGLLQMIYQGIVGTETDDRLPGERLLAALERAVGDRLSHGSGSLCLLFDRYDALNPAERAVAAGPLRALRDAFKYQLTYLIAARRPLEPHDELAELFYANTLWLGPLSPSNARWSAMQYAQRRGQTWDEATLEQLVKLSWGYPALLRACSEAYAMGVPLTLEALSRHPAVQRRVEEFWADQPTPDDLRRSGISGHPLLSAAQPAVTASSPDLTASEHRLLAHFQAHQDEVCEKDALIRAVWPEERIVDGLRDDSLAQLIRRLRQKIGAERIQTIPGRGYQYITAR